jgi:transcription elongation factor Elf1
MSTSSARLPSAKVLVVCDCGKKYRVPATRAGKKISCKACGLKVRVPRGSEVSERSRGNILAELGIDPVAAEQAYQAEAARRRVEKKNYRCMRCDGDISADDVKGAYVQGELVCAGCRASAEVEDRRAAEQRQVDGKKPAAVELAAPVSDPRRAMAAAVGYSAIFLIGVTGPLWAVAGLGFFKAFLLGAVVAGMGGATVYRTRA